MLGTNRQVTRFNERILSTISSYFHLHNVTMRSFNRWSSGLAHFKDTSHVLTALQHQDILPTFD